MIYLAIAVLVFALSGLLSMAGLGAAFIFVPLFYWLGVPLPVASSTALLLNAVSLSFASVTYWRAGLVNWRLGVPVTITAVAAAPMGALLAPHAAKHVLLGLLAAFLVFSGAMMLFYRRGPRRPQPRRQGHALGRGQRWPPGSPRCQRRATTAQWQGSASCGAPSQASPSNLHRSAHPP